MEENKSKLKLIHIILIGVILMLGIVAGVIFLNSGKNESNISTIEKDVSYTEEVKRKSIEEENKEYFQKEVIPFKDTTITKVGKTKNELVFKNAYIENNKLLVKLELSTTAEKLKDLNKLFKYAYARLEIGQEIYSLNQNDDSIFEIAKVDENLYEIYLIYDVRGLKFDRNINFISEIEIVQYDNMVVFYDDPSTEIGKWNLEFSITEDMKKEFDEKYEIENLTVQKSENGSSEEYCKISGVRVLEENVILNCLLDNYSTEPGMFYTIEFFDSENNSLMIYDEVILIGGQNQDILLKKFDLDSKVRASLRVSTEDEELEKINSTFKMTDYIKNIEENSDEKIEKAYGDDVEFSFDSNKFEVGINNIYKEINLNRLEYPIRIEKVGKVDGFSVWEHGFYIEREENEFNESLNELYETRTKLLELGLEPYRRNEYSIYESIGPFDDFGIPTDTIEYVFAHEEIMDIYDGGKVVKNGKEFDKEKIKELTMPMCENKNFGNIKIDGKEAITYVYYNGEGTRKYILMIDEYIYEITVPLNLPIIEDYNKILNTISFKK